MGERIELLGSRNELRAKRLAINIRTDELRDNIRTNLNPAKDAVELDVSGILDNAIKLNEAVIRLQEIEAKIKRIDDILGGGPR